MITPSNKKILLGIIEQLDEITAKIEDIEKAQSYDTKRAFESVEYFKEKVILNSLQNSHKKISKGRDEIHSVLIS